MDAKLCRAAYDTGLVRIIRYRYYRLKTKHNDL